MDKPVILSTIPIDEHTAIIIMKDPIVKVGTFRGFEIFSRQEGARSWRSVANLSAERRTYQVEGLKPNAKYNLRVRGCVNSMGCSDYSTAHILVPLKPG